ncbi:MAG: DUF1858 domain-containing protein [Paludibacteraceae bacterium]
MKEELIITPKAKIWDIIETYPELEEVIVEFAPAFSKLKNPLLRRTIGKVATLQQAAATANVNINELVGVLRKKIGQSGIMEETDNKQYNFARPEWFVAEKVSEELDAREMLSRGEHPVNQVMADLKKLNENEIYKMVISFLPAPLIDKASALGAKHWVDKQDETLYHVYFSK